MPSFDQGGLVLVQGVKLARFISFSRSPYHFIKSRTLVD